MSSTHFSDFQHLIETDPLDLPRAALYYARNLAYPDLNVSYYLRQIDQLAEQATQHIGDGLSTAERAQALAHYLFTVEAFSGNMQTYGDPRNSFLNEVLERRLGIPITLAVIYISVARQLNIPAYGVGLPGHFVVGVDTNSDFPLLLDPFHQGKTITESDCAALIAQSTGYSGRIQPEWLTPQTAELILTRMLNNLRFNYIRTERWNHAIVVIQHMRLVQPEMGELQRDEGLLRLQKKEYYQAAQLLQNYLERYPNASDRDAIRQNMTRALNDWTRLN